MGEGVAKRYEASIKSGVLAVLSKKKEVWVM